MEIVQQINHYIPKLKNSPRYSILAGIPSDYINQIRSSLPEKCHVDILAGDLLPNIPDDKFIDFIVCWDIDCFNNLWKLCANLSTGGMLLLAQLPNELPTIWWELNTRLFLKITSRNIGIIQRKTTNLNLRVAILMVGMTRKYREAANNFMKNFIEPAYGIKFDFYLYTWNVLGEYQYEGKDFEKKLSDNWISKEPLPKQHINELKEIYHPHILEVDDYSSWQQNIQEDFKKFISTHEVTDETLRIYNGVFSQYYQVWKGFNAMEKYINENNIQPYDIVIRTRYDLEIIDKSTLNWNYLYNVTRNSIVSLENWDRNGMRGNWVAGNWQNMKIYSQLYPNLMKFGYDEIRHIKLASIHVPKYIFNYFFADPNLRPERLSEEEIYNRAFPYLKSYIDAFIEERKHLSFHISLIPEILLRWYVEKYSNISVHLEELLKVRVYPGKPKKDGEVGEQMVDLDL